MKSKVDSNWDVMKYKYHYELEHQWDLKKRFIDAHKTKYPEDRLVCLAQLFCNVHFMGCSYEDNIMKLIRELSEGIAEKNQKWEKQSFVTASDAVEARVKDRLNAPPRSGQQSGVGSQQNVNHQQEGQSRVDSSKPNFVNFVQSTDRESSVGSRKRPASPVAEQYFENKLLRTFSERQIKQEINQVVSQGPFGVVVVFQSVSESESPVAVMERTAAAAQMALNYSIIPTNNDNVLGSQGLPLIELPLSRIKIEPISSSFENFELKKEPQSPTKDWTTAAGSFQVKEEPYDSIDYGASASSFERGKAESLYVIDHGPLKEEEQYFSRKHLEEKVENSVPFYESQTDEENFTDSEEEPSAVACSAPPLPPIAYERVKQSNFLKFIQGVIHSDKQTSDQFWCDRSSKNYAAFGEDANSSAATERTAKRKLQAENKKMRKERKKESKRRRLAGDPLDIDEHMEWRKINLALPQRELADLFETAMNNEPHGISAIFRMDYAYERPERILLHTCEMANIRPTFSFIPKKATCLEPVNCKITLDGMFLSSAQGVGRKMAKDAACRLAIDRLKETSFTIVVKSAFVRDGAEVDRELNLPTASQSQAAASVDKSILDSNIGNRLLKMMGWSGGGLGKDSQGIEEPITASGTVDRKGLGLNEGAAFSKKIGKLLQDYIANSDNKEMVFASDFTKEERKTIHEACRRYKLKTKSFGNEPNRQLVVSKRVRPLEIVEDLLKAGWETEKYKLLPPKSYLERFTI